MSTDPKYPKIDGLKIDFTKLREKATANEGKIYVITDTAAKLANQLSIDYPRLARNEKTIISGLKGLLKEIQRLNTHEDIRLVIKHSSNNENMLTTLQIALTQLISALIHSVKLSDSVLSLMQDISQGHEYKVH